MLLMIVVLVCDNVEDVECVSFFLEAGLSWDDPGFEYFISQKSRKGCDVVSFGR